MVGGVVVFQRLDSRCIRQANKALRRGVGVYYHTADPNTIVGEFTRLPVAKAVIEEEQILQLTETVFAEMVRGIKYHQWARARFGSNDIDFAFCRSLMFQLEEVLDLAESIAGAQALRGESVDLFCHTPFAAEFIAKYQHGQLSECLIGLVPPHLRVVFKSARLKKSVWALWRNFVGNTLKCCVLPFLRTRSLYRPRCKTSLVLRTYPEQIDKWGWSGANFNGKQRTVDFVVDGDQIKKEDVLVWVDGDSTDDQERTILAQGYQCELARKISFDLRFLLERGLPALVGFVFVLLRSGTKDDWLGSICLRLYYNHLKTQALIDFHNPSILIAHNDLAVESIARNILLRSGQCRSIYYMHSSNWLIGSDGDWAVHRSFAYLVFDVLVAWGAKMTAYHNIHPGYWGEVWELGCLWSEHAREISESDCGRRDFLSEIAMYARTSPVSSHRIVGIMDTSIEDTYGLSATDLYHFLSDIVDLAQEFDDVCFVYKPKNLFSERIPGERVPLVERMGADGQELKGSIEACSNFKVTTKDFETGIVVGVADVVISACFTSCTVEAIGRGGKGIYYDPTEVFQRAFWNEIPGMVCTNKSQLAKRLRELLYASDDQHYRQYLKRNMNEIDGYIDGRGITRLREHLAVEMKCVQ